MTKFRSIPHGGFYWLAVEANGKITMLHRMARFGECHRDGQRYRGDVK